MTNWLYAFMTAIRRSSQWKLFFFPACVILDNLKLTFNLFPYNLQILFKFFFFKKKNSNTLTRSNKLKSVNRTWTILRNQSSSCWTRRSKTQSIHWERKLTIWTTRQRGKAKEHPQPTFQLIRDDIDDDDSTWCADTQSKYVNWAEENPFCLRWTNWGFRQKQKKIIIR